MKTSLAIFLTTAGALLAGGTPEAGSTEAVGLTPGVTKVLHIRGMDKAPSVIEKGVPAYPTELREQGIQGFATVDLRVDSTGRVVEATLVRATHPLFGERALAAAKAWRFDPATAQGQPITTRVQVPFHFVMPQVAALEQRR